ncbi:AGE family epimerase/isomerase, partial [Bacteroidota bacterium]
QFLWMDEHVHDPEFGGYHEFLMRDGTPILTDSDFEVLQRLSMAKGLKDYNSSIHLMEAITQLYRVWPDDLVRERLEEMFYLIRDTFTHPDGYLQLYFYPDWTMVTDEEMHKRAGDVGHFTNHFTYGHDVETAYLLLETADVLGMGEDEKTHQIAKRLVDHSIESGWDDVNTGFYDAGKLIDGKIEIINDHKSWWGIIEGFNALLLMHYLYPDDPNNYYEKFDKNWTYIDTYLVDKEFGGWYSSGLDKNPGSEKGLKSHGWKTSYHNARGMVNCIRQLRGTYSHH